MTSSLRLARNRFRLLGFGRVGSVALDVRPQDARVRTPGALSLHLGRRLLVLPGRRIVRAERDGFMPAEAAVLVQPGAGSAVHLVLARLPGQLQIDTAGVVAAVSIRAAVGRARSSRMGVARVGVGRPQGQAVDPAGAGGAMG